MNGLIAKHTLDNLEQATSVAFVNIDDERHRLYECTAYLTPKDSFQDYSFKESYLGARTMFKEQLGLTMGFDVNDVKWEAYQKDCIAKHLIREISKYGRLHD